MSHDFISSHASDSRGSKNPARCQRVALALSGCGPFADNKRARVVAVAPSAGVPEEGKLLTRRGRRIGRWIRESRRRRVQQRQDAQRGDQDRGESHSAQSPRTRDRHAALFPPLLFFSLAKILIRRARSGARSGAANASRTLTRWQVNAARFHALRFFCHAHAAFSQPIRSHIVPISPFSPYSPRLASTELFVLTHSRRSARRFSLGSLTN